MACLNIISQWLTLVYHEQTNSKNYQQVVYGYSLGHICRGSWGGSDHCAWPEVTWPEVTPVTCLSGRMFCACATGSCTISALVGPFWSEVTKSGSGPDRNMFSACPLLTPGVFFLSSSNMATGCDLRSLDSFGVPLGVRIRNRKLRNTRRDRRSRDPFGSVIGVLSTTSVSYYHRKPRVLYLAWLLELALVIYPFYFRIVSRLCSTLLRVHLKISTCKMLFFLYF